MRSAPRLLFDTTIQLRRAGSYGGTFAWGLEVATSTAVQLSDYLRKNGDKQLASRILRAVEEARRHTTNESSHAR
jgi:hypothetical protein